MALGFKKRDFATPVVFMGVRDGQLFEQGTATTPTSRNTESTNQVVIQLSDDKNEMARKLTFMLEVTTGCTENLEDLVAFASKTKWYDGEATALRQKMAKVTHPSGYVLLQHYQANTKIVTVIDSKAIVWPQELLTGNLQGRFEEVFVKFDSGKHFIEDEFQYDSAFARFCFQMEENQRSNAQRLGRTLFNGENLRLSGLELVQDVGYVKIKTKHQPVYYFTGLGTNYALDIPDTKDNTLRKLAHSSGELKPLEKSIMANPIGINILIISADEQIILQHRTMKVTVRPGEACSSTSGTVDSDDVKFGGSYHPILRAVYREMVEEIGLKEKDMGVVVFLGAVREFLRGGLPDFFFAAKSKFTQRAIIDNATSLSKAKDNWAD